MRFRSLLNLESFLMLAHEAPLASKVLVFESVEQLHIIVRKYLTLHSMHKTPFLMKGSTHSGINKDFRKIKMDCYIDVIASLVSIQQCL